MNWSVRSPKDMKVHRKIYTTPKGYRLRPSTHRQIKNMQKELKLSQEKIIRSAIKLFSENINAGRKKFSDK